MLWEAHRGSSQREIARLPGRSASTICRELALGRLGGTPRGKPVARGALWRFVWLRLVKFRWSPEQIAALLRAQRPDDRQARVGHKTIIAMIRAEPRRRLKAALVDALRQRKHRHMQSLRKWLSPRKMMPLGPELTPP